MKEFISVDIERASKLIVSKDRHERYYLMVDMKGQDSQCYYLSHDDQRLLSMTLRGM